MLFNEPKLLKFYDDLGGWRVLPGFSALQRAEIAEMARRGYGYGSGSAGFSALQRAEIAEIAFGRSMTGLSNTVSVLFNEPKLLKYCPVGGPPAVVHPFQCSSTSRNC